MLRTKTVVEVNQAMNTILREYLNENVAIRFDLPDIDATQADAAVSVFLYDIHEDLQLRTAESRAFSASAGRLLPGWINIQCNYLITYWEPTAPANDASNPDSQPDNQAIQVMSQVLDALINNRQLSGIPGAYTQVIPPKENLNSLGNFWQSLGNRPRLSLNYSITVPISLSNSDDKAIPISSLSADIAQTASLLSSVINGALRERLIAAIGGGADIRLAMTHVNLKTAPVVNATNDVFKMVVSLSVSGITRAEYLNQMESVFDRWVSNETAVVTLDGYDVYINAVDKSKLSGI
ncbi:hypothetical protein Z042_02545 [Chania multitudinisentens RB-25]|uniref:Pvc16 N-terminal domain-containing protein n=1 Tax=Chania multitudinisentens RB-25 TaxID=1441930 RepID=W0L4I5_9GAMM|nr:DUF4255 domain-containing protein [Chania multitudinisentens]AHG18621.1 hypothetical protein Z042_02545 [Chania multitudinisentens RB-25]